MNQSLALQALNGMLSVTSLCATFIFLKYLWENCEDGYKELRPAIALLFVWIGSTVLRLPIFYQRTLANVNMESYEPTTTIFLGGLLMEVAILCCIRVFAPQKWKYWSWLSTLIISTIVVGSSLIFVYWR